MHMSPIFSGAECYDLQRMIVCMTELIAVYVYSIIITHSDLMVTTRQKS